MPPAHASVPCREQAADGAGQKTAEAKAQGPEDPPRQGEDPGPGHQAGVVPERPGPAARQEVFDVHAREPGTASCRLCKLLDDPPEDRRRPIRKTCAMQPRLLEKKLDDFGVRAEVVTILPGR